MDSIVEPLITLTHAAQQLKISGADLLEYWRRERLPVVRNPLRPRQVRLYVRDVQQFMRDIEEQHPDDIAHAARTALSIQRAEASCVGRARSGSRQNGQR